MPDGQRVYCYGCGQRYEPTPENTEQHTNHADGVGDAVSREQLKQWLETCQRERDEALRGQGR